VEYTYRASLAEMPTTICLAEYNLTVKKGKQETVIPYAGINEVVLNKRTGKLFRIQLLTEGGRPIVITNTYCTTSKDVEDRSRAYSTFVRVLHFHLKDKSKANFSSGNSTRSIWTQVVVTAAIGLLVSITLGYLGFGLISPVADGVVFSVAFGAIVVALRLGRFPKTYTPTDIPLEFLP